jgi:hypothetical protein
MLNAAATASHQGSSVRSTERSSSACSTAIRTRTATVAMPTIQRTTSHTRRLAERDGASGLVDDASAMARRCYCWPGCPGRYRYARRLNRHELRLAMKQVQTPASVTDVSDPHPAEPSAPSRSRLGEALGWLVLCGLTIWALTGTLSHDYTQRPVVGDQAGNLMQMLSLAHDGHDLSYDELDAERWRELHWSDHPHGLYFQRFSGGWAFAKPYGYSLSLVGPYRVFGSPLGIAVANSALLVAMVALAVALLRLRLRGPAVPLVAAAFVFASNAYLHAFPVVVDLFLAVVVAGAVYALLRGLRDEHLGWQVAGFALVGLLLAEKVPLLTALAPICVLALWRAVDRNRRALLAGVAIVAFGVAVVPYVYYSDGQSWTPYGGERYYAAGEVPFDTDPTAPLFRVDSDETVSISYVWSRVSSPSSWADSAQSAFYYVAGRHSGLLVWFPIALLIVALTLTRVGTLPGEAVAMLAGLGLYVAFYLALFPDNYYGGGQAIGNRYFLHVAPLVLGLAATARLPGARLVASALVAGALSLTLMWTHHDRPDWALVDLQRTSKVQRLLPFETNQLGADYWRCGFGVCPDPDD